MPCPLTVIVTRDALSQDIHKLAYHGCSPDILNIELCLGLVKGEEMLNPQNSYTEEMDRAKRRWLRLIRETTGFGDDNPATVSGSGCLVRNFKEVIKPNHGVCLLRVKRH